MKNIDVNDREKQIRALRERTMLAENHRGPWSKEDKAKLKELFDGTVGITDMALYFQRSELAVAHQIAKLYPKVRRPNQGKEGCKCPQCIHYKNCSGPCPEQKTDTEQLES